MLQKIEYQQNKQLEIFYIPLTVSILLGFTAILLGVTTKGENIYKTHINSVLEKMSNINSWRKDFINESLILFLCIKGRINFLQLARFGNHEEQRYRQQFEKPFDF